MPGQNYFWLKACNSKLELAGSGGISSTQSHMAGGFQSRFNKYIYIDLFW